MVQSISERLEEHLYDAAKQSASAIKAVLQPHPELWKTKQSPLEIPEQAQSEFITGIIGQQSAGKSTLLNSICCYPILPAASVITSERPVEIRKSDLDNIQVVWTEDDKDRTVDFSLVQLEESFVRSLLEYGIKCCRNNIITCDNLNYLTTKSIRADADRSDLKPEDFDLFDPKNHRQVMMLLMILLGTHVGTYGGSTESDLREEIKSMHHRLMTRLGLGGRHEFTIRLFWNSTKLCDGMVLMDLPGLRDTAGRSTVTFHQLHRLDAVVLLFSPSQEQPDLYRFLKDYQNQGKRTPSPCSYARVTAVLNKADLCGEKLEETISSIRKKCGFTDNIPVYPICAASGEYLYVSVGGINQNATFLCKDNPHWSREEGERQLREAYEKSYQSLILAQIQQIMTEDLTERIRTLDALNWLEDTIAELEELKHRIMLHHSFLVCLEKCGTIFTKAFHDALSRSCSEVQDAFRQEFGNSTRRLLDDLMAAEEFEEVASAFRSGLTQMEGDILDRVELSFRQMKRRSFRINLDSRENQSVYQNLYRWLGGTADIQGSRLCVSSYLQSGNRLLESSLNRQYQVYREGIGELVGKYLEFPCLFKCAFQAACEQAGEALLTENSSLTRDDFANYQEQALILQETVSSYLTATVQIRVRMLESDRSVAEAFSKTADLTRDYQQVLEEFYYRQCPDMLTQCCSAALMTDTVYFSPRKARSQFRNSFYASGAKNRFLTALETLMTGLSDPELSNGGLRQWFAFLHRKIRNRNTHPQRVKQAVGALNRQFCTYIEKDLRRFSTEIKKTAKTLMNSGKNVYISENTRLSNLNSRVLSQISTLKTSLKPHLLKLKSDVYLCSDAAAVLKKLNDL